MSTQSFVQLLLMHDQQLLVQSCHCQTVFNKLSILFADLCAIDAKKTTPCIVPKNSPSSTCPALLSGATCSALTGVSPSVHRCKQCCYE